MSSGVLLYVEPRWPWRKRHDRITWGIRALTRLSRPHLPRAGQVNDAKARMYWWALDDNAPARSAQMMIDGRPYHDLFDDEKKVGLFESGLCPLALLSGGHSRTP